MFKFEFAVEEQEDQNPFKSTETNDINDKNGEDIQWYQSEEISPQEEILEKLDVYELNARTISVGNVILKYVVSGFLVEDICRNETSVEDIKTAEQKHSDLVPGVYEGGAKIWECTHDLLDYLSQKCEIHWKDKRVLDLGCGSGLLGIYAYKCGSTVHFQDYNKDVLQSITIPNMLLNNMQSADHIDEAVKFYSGDWSSYAQLTTEDEKFDVILTAETIYNPENQQKLLDTFHAKLKPNGVVILAAKTYYFGVGGGLRQFEELIAKSKRFQSQVVWSANADGLNREILELTHS